MSEHQEEFLEPTSILVESSKFIENSWTDVRICFPTATTEPPYNSWIGLYKANAPDTSYLSYVYLSNNNKTRREGRDLVIPYQLPSKPGKYNFRYFEDKSYLVKAQSFEIHVGSIIDVKISNNPEPFEKNSKIFAEWELIFGNEIQEGWIGLFPEGDQVNYVFAEKVTNPSWMKNYGLKPIGKITFPKPVLPKKYCASFFTKDNICLGTSNSISIIDRLFIKTKSLSIIVLPDLVTLNSKPHIGIFKEDSEELYQGSHIEPTEELEFKMKKDGCYKVRLYLDDSYMNHVYEEKVVIQKKDRIELLIRGNKVIAGLYVDTEYYDWSNAFVGLYKKNSDNFKFEMYQQVSEKEKVVIFRKVPNGVYTVRFIQNTKMLEDGSHLESQEFEIVPTKIVNINISKGKSIKLKLLDVKHLEEKEGKKIYVEFILESQKKSSTLLQQKDHCIFDENFEFTIRDLKYPLLANVYSMDNIDAPLLISKFTIDLKQLKKENDLWIDQECSLHLNIEAIGFNFEDTEIKK